MTTTQNAKHRSRTHLGVAAWLAAAMLTAPLGAAAATRTTRTPVEVASPWVRGVVPGQTATGAFMVLRARRDATLVAAASPVAASVEIHQMQHDGEITRMRTVPALGLPAMQPVELGPRGYHLMLVGLKAPLRAGDQVPIALTFELANKKRVTQTVRAEVRGVTEDGAQPK